MIATTRTEEATTTAYGRQPAPPWVRWLAPTLFASGLLRAVILATSTVQTTPDSPGYAALADSLRHRTLADDPGERTPVYPLFLALYGLHLPLIRLAQMALGIGITAALFWLAWRLARNARIAALVAASYGLSITAVLHEDAILTETLATALLIALACLVYRAEACSTHIRILAITLGTVSGLIALTRPLYAFLPIVLILPFTMMRRFDASWHMIAQGICLTLFPALLIVGGWSAYNAARFGTFAPTVLTGYNLSNHSGGFIEDAPERDALLRDVYLKYRAETIAETGSHVTTIWAARPEMLARTGLTNAQLSQTLTSLSLRLFVHHPVGYVESVAGSWLRFWNSPGEWRWQGADNARIGSVVGAFWMAQRCGLIAVNALFLLLTVGALCSRRLRAWWRPSPLLITLCALVWATAVVQALLESGSNTRFGVPTQPLVVFVVIVSAVSFIGPAARILPWRPSCDSRNAAQPTPQR